MEFALREIFPAPEYILKIIHHPNSHLTICEITDIIDGKCITIEIHHTAEPFINIAWVQKCFEKTGPYLLKQVENLALRLQINKINLTDESTLPIKNSTISLKTLYFLTTGRSWYNTKGYFAKNQPEQDEYNMELITHSVAELIELCRIKRIESDEYTDSQMAAFEEILEYSIGEIQQTLSNLNIELPTNVYFSIVREQLKNEDISEDIVSFFEILIDYIYLSNIFIGSKYTKEIITPQILAGKSIRNKKTKNKKTKNKKTKNKKTKKKTSN